MKRFSLAKGANGCSAAMLDVLCKHESSRKLPRGGPLPVSVLWDLSGPSIRCLTRPGWAWGPAIASRHTWPFGRECCLLHSSALYARPCSRPQPMCLYLPAAPPRACPRALGSSSACIREVRVTECGRGGRAGVRVAGISMWKRVGKGTTLPAINLLSSSWHSFPQKRAGPHSAVALGHD